MSGGHLRGRAATVVGGGVAGLAVARAAALRGATVRLFEQSHEIAEVGAGIQISPNGLCVIDALGLGAELRAVSLRADAVILRNGKTGQKVLRLDLARAPGDYLLVHRARLIEVLAKGAGAAGVDLVLGHRAGPGEAGLTLAADGIHSVHRSALNGEAEAGFTGQVAWRALIAEPDAAPVVEVFMGPGRHLVTYPLAGGLRNIVAVEERSAWAAEGWHHQDDPGALRSAFAGFGGPVPAWLSRVETVHLWGLFRHPVAEHWYGKAVALLGDAAHPTLPFLAQGANMALEDAWVLADCLDRHETPEAGFTSYQTRRRARVSRVVDAASANARNYHLSGIRQRAAHAGLRLAGRLAPTAALKRFDWLYGVDVTKD